VSSAGFGASMKSVLRKLVSLKGVEGFQDVQEKDALFRWQSQSCGSVQPPQRNSHGSIVPIVLVLNWPAILLLLSFVRKASPARETDDVGLFTQATHDLINMCPCSTIDS